MTVNSYRLTSPSPYSIDNGAQQWFPQQALSPCPQNYSGCLPSRLMGLEIRNSMRYVHSIDKVCLLSGTGSKVKTALSYLKTGFADVHKAWTFYSGLISFGFSFCQGTFDLVESTSLEPQERQSNMPQPAPTSGVLETPPTLACSHTL
jgi:hypothetical protein